MTCAACHTAEIEYAGRKIRIDGGPTMADAIGFINEFDKSLEETYKDGLKEDGRSGEKFDRYAQHFEGKSKEALLDQLGKVVQDREDWRVRNDPPKAGNPGFAGFARLDAFGVIFNEVTNDLLGIPSNNRVPNAPVSYPFLWDTHHHNWTQWNGTSSAIPMGRNVGQVLGVFGKVNMQTHSTSIRLKNLRDLQSLVKKLRSPVWPEEILGEIDRDRAKKGEQLFEDRCVGCHRIQKRTEPLKSIDIEMTQLNPKNPEEVTIGTDPKMAVNAARKVMSSIKGDELIPASELASSVARDIIRQDLWEAFLVLFDVIPAYFDNWTLTQPTPLAYKARPLDGIWATAPYLHNGSVPNLYEVLLPADQRTKRFCVGIKEFDPQKVGFATVEKCPDQIGTELDTTLEGNWNSGHDGHDYGNDTLTEEQRWQLVEYQKTL